VSSGVRVRFAPSPTGKIHVGNIRTAVFNYLFARHVDGAFLLRIEDTDKERSTPEAEAQLLDALAWMGLDWDREGAEGFVRQSVRTERHMAVVEDWLAKGLAYRSARRTGEFGPVGSTKSSGRRGGEKAESLEGEAVWFKTTPEDIGYDDLILGPQVQPSKQLQDFVIVRSTGQPMFILANVIDDLDMRITHALRGADHKTNTFRQILLYRALGAEPPRYGHLPLIVDAQGKKLSKRETDPDSIVFMSEFRERGYLPEALLNFLAFLGWTPEPLTGSGGETVFREKLSREELVREFDLCRVSRSPARFDTVKLGALNYDYMQDMLAADPGKLVRILKEDVAREGLDPGRFTGEQYEVLVREAAQRAQTLKDLLGKTRFFFADKVEVDAGSKKVRKAFKKSDVWANLDATAARLEATPEAEWKRECIEGELKALADELAEGKMGAIAQPVRILVAGGPASPAIDVTLELLGRERTLARLRDPANRQKLDQQA
jgi:glutamyl-tRNA synthetase